MKSYEVLRQVFKPVGCKNVAAELGLSLSLIYQWSRAQNGQSEATNPLDRVAQLVALPGGESLLDWLCRQVGGEFVRGGKLRVLAGKEWEQMKGEMDAILCRGNGKTEPGQVGGRACRYRRKGGRCGFTLAGRN